MKTKLLSLLVLAVFGLSLTSFSQPDNPEAWKKRKMEHKKMMMKRSAKGPEERGNFFTEEQKESIKVLRLEAAKKVKPLKNELRELTAHQKTLTTAENADLKAINKNIDKMSDVKAELAKIQAAQHQQVRSLLSEEQLLKFDSMKSRRDHNQMQNRSSGQFRHGKRGA